MVMVKGETDSVLVLESAKDMCAIFWARELF